MSNKVKYGLKNVHYAVITELNGIVTYGIPTALPGAVNLILSPKGEQSIFYAEDTSTFISIENQGYEGTLEIALVPDEFRINVLGEKIDVSGTMFEDANAEPKKIALMYEFDGDVNTTRHLLYNVSIDRPNIEGSTRTTSKEIKTDTMNITASPAINTGYVKAKAKATDASYAGWFANVYEYAGA
jgi:phi13 family phage major tail protein